MTLPGGVENLTLDGYAVNGGTVTGLQYEAWGRDTRARYVGNDSNNIIDASQLGQRANFLQTFLGGMVIDGGAGADTMTGMLVRRVIPTSLTTLAMWSLKRAGGR